MSEAERIDKVVEPVAHFGGTLQVPGDKSISHRIAMLAGLAHGTSRITGFLRGEDCECTLNAMAQLGAQVELLDHEIRVMGTGGTLTQPDAPLYMGNSGTGIRLLSGLLSGYPIEVTLTGDASLSARPMERIATPLRKMGATLALTGERGTPPLTIKGGNLHGIEYPLPMASAQVKSCILLAGLNASGETSIREPAPTRDHTEKLFQQAGIELHINGLHVVLPEQQLEIKAQHWVVPGDISSAAFWIATAAAMPGARLTINQVGLNPRRTALLKVLQRMGADIQIEMEQEHGEPYGTIHVSGSQLKGTCVEGEEIPNVIDEIPILATIATQAEGKTTFKDALELRVKETDRIDAMVKNLRILGAEVEEWKEGFAVAGPVDIQPAEALPSYGDHRIAMSMAMAGVFSSVPLTLLNTQCIQTSYPQFWEHYHQLTR